MAKKTRPKMFIGIPKKKRKTRNEKEWEEVISSLHLGVSLDGHIYCGVEKIADTHSVAVSILIRHGAPIRDENKMLGLDEGNAIGD